MVFATADREPECSKCAEKSKCGAGRFVGAANGNLSARAPGTCFRGTGTIAALRVAISVPGDFDLESVFQRRYAGIEFVADIDILTIAKQRPIGSLTSCLAAALEVGFACREALVLTIELALHVDVGITRPVTGRFALGIAICAGWRHLAACVAFTVTRRLALRTATIGIGCSSTSRIAVSRTAGFARCGAIKFGGINRAVRLARSIATRGAGSCHHRVTAAIAIDIQLRRAFSGEADWGAGCHATTINAHFTLRIRVDLNETARIDNTRLCRGGKAHERGGKSGSKNGGKEVTHVDSPGSPDKVRFASTHRHRLSAPNEIGRAHV